MSREQAKLSETKRGTFNYRRTEGVMWNFRSFLLEEREDGRDFARREIGVCGKRQPRVVCAQGWEGPGRHEKMANFDRTCSLHLVCSEAAVSLNLPHSLGTSSDSEASRINRSKVNRKYYEESTMIPDLKSMKL